VPDDWGDEFGGDWDLEGDEMLLDDELELDEELEHDEETSADHYWDVHGIDELEGTWDLEEVDELGSASGGDAAPVGGGGGDGGAAWGGAGGRATTGERMSWSAWDVGFAFGLGGWLLDQHAEQVGREVRAALAHSSTPPATHPGPRGAPHPPPPSGQAHGTDAGTHGVGDPLRLGWLHSELADASVRSGDLLLQAEGDGPGGGRLVLVVSAVPGSAGPSLWVVAEQRPGGFAASRLVPVFQADGSGGFAVFATDLAGQAVDAVAWACAREGVRPESLTISRRS
jgi:hypothetical protein